MVPSRSGSGVPNPRKRVAGSIRITKRRRIPDGLGFRPAIGPAAGPVCLVLSSFRAFVLRCQPGRVHGDGPASPAPPGSRPVVLRVHRRPTARPDRPSSPSAWPAPATARLGKPENPAVPPRIEPSWYGRMRFVPIDVAIGRLERWGRAMWGTSPGGASVAWGSRPGGAVRRSRPAGGRRPRTQDLGPVRTAGER